MNSPYVKAPFPRLLFAKFKRFAIRLGYTKKGQKWEYLERAIDATMKQPKKFRRQS